MLVELTVFRGQDIFKLLDKRVDIVTFLAVKKIYRRILPCGQLPP